MAFINYTKREIQLKVVYYGAKGSGKTENIKRLYETIQESQRGDLVTLPSEVDAGVFFDFLMLKTDYLSGFDTTLQVYSVPGTIEANATRRSVLKGVDGIVFVADSNIRHMQDNILAFSNLQENLIENRLSLAQIPYVLQYNKRNDEGAAPLSYMEFVFNNRATQAVSIEASAAENIGVTETFNAISKVLLSKYSKSTTSAG
jgi:hypothetical protein